MQGSDEEAEGEEQDPPQPAFPSAGYTSAANFQPGFGFGCPSKSWLKARGIIKPAFKGGSGFAGVSEEEPMQVEEEKKAPAVPQEKRVKLLQRFDHPEDYIPVLEAEVEEPPSDEPPQVRHTDAKVRTIWESKAPVSLPTPIVQEGPERPCFPRLAGLFESKAGTDVEIVLDEGVRLKVHKAVLAARSQFFSQMFTSHFAESAAREVQLPGFSQAAVHALMQFFYEGQLRTTGEFVLELLLLAEYCRVAGLKALIEEYLGRNVDEDNVAALAAAAVDCRAWQLREYCVKFLLKHYSKTRLLKEVPKEVAAETKDRHQLLF